MFIVEPQTYTDNSMEHEIAENFWSDKAETVKTSGRWTGINNQIKILASDKKLQELHFEGKQNVWMFDVFSSLCSQILEEYIYLKESYHKENVSISPIAWRTRNLLELVIWSSYCSNSIDNARCFYEDAGKDLNELIKSHIDWGISTSQNSDWTKSFSDAQAKLKNNMISKNIKNIDAKYTKVHFAAKKIGLEEHYKLANKILSKFVHPSAMLILRPNPNFDQELATSFFEEGCMNFCAAFDIVEIWLNNPKEKKY